MKGAELGDIVVADWGGTRPASLSADHLMGITALDPIKISAHGNDRLNTPLYGPKGSDSIKGQAPGASFMLLHLK